MKVPPAGLAGITARSTEEKDKTLTKRTVKGAGGGMQGVDYEDDRRPDPSLRAGENKDPRAARRSQRTEKTREQNQPAVDDRPRVDGGEGNLGSSGLVEESIEQAQARRKSKKTRGVGIHAAVSDGAEEERQEPDERDDPSDPFADDDVDREAPKGGLADERRLREPGDVSILDPSEIERIFKDPVSYAKHAMVLAESFRRGTGATRQEGIDYLARLLLAPKDRSFARATLRELGPATGILDIYPLEVVAHALVEYPGYLPKAGFGTLLRRVERSELTTDTLTPLIVQYRSDLKIRGFALVGGGRPGYRFEPVDPDESTLEGMSMYALSFDAPGRFEILVSGVTKTGHTIVDRLIVNVLRSHEDDRPDVVPEPSLPRTEQKVAEWPKPQIRQLDLDEILGVEIEPQLKKAVVNARDLDQKSRLKALESKPVDSGFDVSVASSFPGVVSGLPSVDDLVVSERIPKVRKGRSPEPKQELRPEVADLFVPEPRKERPRAPEVRSRVNPEAKKETEGRASGTPVLRAARSEEIGRPSRGENPRANKPEREAPADLLPPTKTDVKAAPKAEAVSTEPITVEIEVNPRTSGAAHSSILDDGETEALDRRALMDVIRESTTTKVPSLPASEKMRGPATLAELDAPTEALDRDSVLEVVRSFRMEKPKR